MTDRPCGAGPEAAKSPRADLPGPRPPPARSRTKTQLRPAGGTAPQAPAAGYAADYADAVVSHIPALRVFARSLCRNPVEADDLVQDTLLRGIEKHAQFTPGTNLRAWLFTIMRNRFYSTRVKLGREPTGGEACVSNLPQGAAEGQYWHLRLLEMDRALQALPVHYRETIMLIGVLGESYQDAAEILGCDIGTVKSRMSRARAALREKIGAPEPGDAS